jgi:hypothetical protein
MNNNNDTRKVAWEIIAAAAAAKIKAAKVTVVFVKTRK